MPSDWLAKLSASLQPDKPSSEWKSFPVIAEKCRLSRTTLRDDLARKISAGELEAKQFRVRHNGKLVLLWHYRPRK